jgi:signal transduction histidine kinase
METELREAKAQAEEAARLKSAMLANMSHEIRTPLTTITGFADMLASDLEGEPARLAGMVHENSQRLQNTLTSVLQLSKLEADGMALDRSPVDVTAVVGEVVQLLQPNAHTAEVDLRTEMGPDFEWHGDEEALRRIVTNLTENAIKFTPEGGVVVVRVRADASTVRLVVEDTGVGIDDDFLPNIFSAFEQEHGGLDREHEGSGLGLAITQRLVEALEGAIDVESEKGVGTQFTVRLPREGPA